MGSRDSAYRTALNIVFSGVPVAVSGVTPDRGQPRRPLSWIETRRGQPVRDFCLVPLVVSLYSMTTFIG